MDKKESEEVACLCAMEFGKRSRFGWGLLQSKTEGWVGSEATVRMRPLNPDGLYCETPTFQFDMQCSAL